MLFETISMLHKNEPKKKEIEFEKEFQKACLEKRNKSTQKLIWFE